MNFTDCIPLSWYCPVNCAKDKVMCPMVMNYRKDGTWLDESPPPKGKECAADYKDCACGKGSKRCPGDLWCQPSTAPCPLTCKAGERECEIVSFNKTDGAMTGKRIQCVDEKQMCPCGKNAKACKIGGVSTCYSTVQAKDICPCPQSKDVCHVQDYDKQGKASGGLRAQCVAKGTACPCGKNADSCQDTQSESGPLICKAKFGKDKCPKPCTPTEE